MLKIRDEILINAQSALGTKGSVGPLTGARHVRVYAEWAAGVTAGVVTVRHRARKGSGNFQDEATTLAFVAGKASSLRVEGPIGEVEVEITTAVVAGTVTVILLAEA